ncbi:serine/arginine repetitive matrix protein 1-like [Ananas comosus]|uniref:Serine/arginine repetitive matrix protein 1-like n=1 Tax=Ananas comosus TaxID=4615 RepID=A0A6P5EBQ8_ANACO|nr:serine/arginine repetitive matrix protein 1-like [Ananas comosus]
MRFTRAVKDWVGNNQFRRTLVASAGSYPSRARAPAAGVRLRPPEKPGLLFLHLPLHLAASFLAVDHPGDIHSRRALSFGRARPPSASPASRRRSPAGLPMAELGQIGPSPGWLPSRALPLPRSGRAALPRSPGDLRRRPHRQRTPPEPPKLPAATCNHPGRAWAISASARRIRLEAGRPASLCCRRPHARVPGVPDHRRSPPEAPAAAQTWCGPRLSLRGLRASPPPMVGSTTSPSASSADSSPPRPPPAAAAPPGRSNPRRSRAEHRSHFRRALRCLGCSGNRDLLAVRAASLTFASLVRAPQSPNVLRMRVNAEGNLWTDRPRPQATAEIEKPLSGRFMAKFVDGMRS